MTKDEALKFGVSEDKYRAFQAVYHKDLDKMAAKKRAEDTEEYNTRSAIVSMLKLIKKPQTLNKVLNYVHKAYFEEV